MLRTNMQGGAERFAWRYNAQVLPSEENHRHEQEEHQ